MPHPPDKASAACRRFENLRQANGLNIAAPSPGSGPAGFYTDCIWSLLIASEDCSGIFIASQQLSTFGNNVITESGIFFEYSLLKKSLFYLKCNPLNIRPKRIYPLGIKRKQ
jgi:hypothetical protein